MRPLRPLVLLILPVLAGAVEVAWPTAMPRPDIRRPETFVQPAASGTVESGMFGMTRNDGTRFHEGLDIRPLAHDGRGEAVDLVRAALPGRVAYSASAPPAPTGATSSSSIPSRASPPTRSTPTSPRSAAT